MWWVFSLQSPPNTEVYFALQDTKVASKFEELAEGQKSMWQSLILSLSHFLVQTLFLRCLTMQISHPPKKQKQKPESVGQSLSYLAVWTWHSTYQSTSRKLLLFQWLMQIGIYCSPSALHSTRLWGPLPASRFPRNPNPYPCRLQRAQHFNLRAGASLVPHCS